jgi:ERF superfamily
MTMTGTASGATPARAASRSRSSTPAPTTKTTTSGGNSGGDGKPQPQTLAAALAALQTVLPRIGKNQTGKVDGVSKATGKPFSYNYKYSNLTSVSEALLPLMGSLGLSFSAKPTLSESGQFVLAYRLRHVSGEEDAGEYPLGQGSPQQLGGYITYARRYILLAMTGAAPDEDDDDAQQAEQAARAQRNAPPETRADGSATDAELMRMTRGHEPGAERAAAVSPDDPWYDQKPGDVLPEEMPRSSLPTQRQDIYIAMSKRDITTPAARKEAIERLIGHEVSEAREMSFNEAEMVKAAVAGWDGRTERLLSPLAAERSKADA